MNKLELPAKIIPPTKRKNAYNGVMMRIVHLSTTHCVDDVRVVHKECRSLAELGHEVTVILPAERVPSCPEGVQFHPVPLPRSRITRMTVTAWTVFRLAWRTPADVYHFHSPELIPWMFLLLLRGCPIVYDVHEDFSTGIKRAIYLPYWVAVIYAYVLRIMENIAKKCFVIVIAERYYSRIFPDSFEILNYPKTEYYSSLQGRRVPDFGIGSNSKTILYAGVLVRQRGALIYADLAREMPEVVVRVAGTVPPKLADEMRQRSNSSLNLEIVGTNTRLDYHEIISNYHKDPILGLAIFPDSDHYRDKELTKFFEYMAAGIPIVCSNFPVWQRLIEGNGVGICVDPTDLPATIKAIRELMADRARRQVMADQGQALVREKFNWDSEAARLDFLYVSLLSVNSPSSRNKSSRFL